MKKNEPEREKRPVLTWGAIGFLVLFLFLFLAGIIPLFHRQSAESACRTRCLSNLRMLGQALLLYTNAHAGACPDSLVTLVRESEDLEEHWFVCPSASPAASRRSGMPPPTTQQLAAQLAAPGGTSYLYLGAPLTAPVASDVVVMYEPLANHSGDGMSVLFGDGGARYLAKAEAQTILNQIATGVRRIRYLPPPAIQPASGPIVAP